ncbi:hypothetical protein [Actinomadura madurae]|uniref:hypothetical protein n=1 Tax=Actinomadura madurae TaxID=1993 RepID=UPI0020D21A41|nr:hypothetical protein [Actinomadura madurae]MCP9952082.1 hypothetical protein [Actinomadura madurae]MCP9968844.1 hypothetical protein [Actinomadura madurae]MCP9981322.1 hypothetical protein [Actinomadura madurae]MCQ0007174.1 hypothetical protein [Actinomadura madurae]MCQ0017517.1 hypothetical protein [Actinomadura madurae]
MSDSPPADHPGGDEFTPPAQPLMLRPSRKPLIWLLPLCAVLAWLCAKAYGSAGVPSVFVFLLAVLVVQAALIFKLLRGYTEADEFRLRSRLVFRTRTMRWSDAVRFSVIPTLFGRVVQVQPGEGKKFFLAAPRDGLLGREPGMDATLNTMRALADVGQVQIVPRTVRTVRTVLWGVVALSASVAVFLGQPWLDPWWPGRAEATTIPRACSAIDPALQRRMLPGPADPEEAQDFFKELSHSVWSGCFHRHKGGNSLSLDLELVRRGTFESATDKARERMARERKSSPNISSGGPRLVPVPGLGDEAWRLPRREDTADGLDFLMVRHANVLVKVEYDHGRRSAAQGEADVLALVRATIARVKT